MSNSERSIPNALPVPSLHLHFIPRHPKHPGACAVCRIDEETATWRECERCGVGFHETCHRAGIGSVTTRAGAEIIAADVCPGCCS